MPLLRRLVPLALIVVGLACGGGSEGPAAPPPPPAPAVTTVEVTPASANIVAPGEVTLAATVKDQNGNIMNGKAVAWSSSDAANATVAADGRVTVIRPGTTTITATVEGKSGSATITGLAPVARVAVSSDSLLLAAGDTVTLVATPRDAQGNPLPQRPVTWQSPDPAIATTIDIFPADPWVGTWVGTQTVPNLGRTINRTAIGRPGIQGANRYQIDFGFGEICFLVVASDNSTFTGNCTDGFQNNLPIAGTRAGTSIAAKLGVCPVCSWSNGVLNLTRR